jgi:hypothetical protein
MNTRVFSNTLQGGPRSFFAGGNAIAWVFRDRNRLVVSLLAVALVMTAICAPPAVKSVVKPAFIAAPANLKVTAVSSTSISLSWDRVDGASHYSLERSESMSGPFTLQQFVFQGATSITDNFGVSPHIHAYVYRVRAVTPEKLYSAPSNMALGTAISFEFQKLVEIQGGQVVRREVIKARHFHDVRNAINAVRRVANMSEIEWPGKPLNNLIIKASDVKEMRDALDEALFAFTLSPPLPYDDPALNTGAIGTLIRAIHIEQLQERSTRASSPSSAPLYNNHISKGVVGWFDPNSIYELPLVTVHLSVLPNQKVLFWGRDLETVNVNGEEQIVTVPDGQPGAGNGKQVVGHSEAWVWDITTNARQRFDNPNTNLFCSGHSFLPDGRLIVTGGHGYSNTDGVGEKHINIFDYRNNSNPWSRGHDMNQGRWYPYNVTLSSGEPMVVSGSYNDNPGITESQPNLVPVIFTAAETLKNLNQPASRFSNYPYIYLMPDGKVLQAQSGLSDQESRLFDPRANQSLGTNWPRLSSMLSTHNFGTSVLYEDGRKALVVGGQNNSGEPLPVAEFIDLVSAQSLVAENPPKQPWTPLESMKFARVYPTATILPDGKVLVTGGVGCPGTNNIESYLDDGTLVCSDGQVMNPELWDPETGKWTVMAPHTEIRAYHSVAALLPDGRVLVGGGGLPGAVGEIGYLNERIMESNLKPNALGFGHKKVEIFSPPYLFDKYGDPAVRPLITSEPPQSVTNGETFFIGTSGTGNQPKVSLVRLPSVTHAFNQDQRQITLEPTLASGGLYVTAPSSPNQCPPGIYMLFVLNSSGVPSLAKMITMKNSVLLPNDMPETTATGAGSTWEQGIEFSSAVNGQITHIRFWKAPGEPSGGHVGRIWNATTGQQLASAVFVNESGSGWQEAQLATPLPITAGVRYKVTYNLHSVVAKTFNVLNYPITSWPLVGWGSSFSTPAGTFPTTSNLFADIRFK